MTEEHTSLKVDSSVVQDGHDPQWLPKIYVIDETTGERTHLNFMVYVRPIVKPRVRPKLRRDGA